MQRLLFLLSLWIVRCIPTVCILLCTQYNAAAQGNRYVLIDATTNKPVVAATIRLTCWQEQEQVSATTAISDRNGLFSIPCGFPAAVLISHVGYTTLRDTLRSAQSDTLWLYPKAIVTETVVATAQYAPQQADQSMYKVRVFSQERIQAQAASTLQDLLATELNVRTSHDAVLGSSMSIQGIAGQNVAILVDGIPLVGRLNGNVDIGQVALNTAETVEIIEGPLSTLYGSNALGGVVNIITKQPEAVAFGATSSLLYESVGTYNADASVNLSAGKTSARLTGGRHFFGGYSEMPTERAMQWKPREQYMADWQLRHALNAWDIRYSGKYFYDYILNKGNLRTPYYETAFDDTYRTTRWSHALFANGTLASHHVDISASYSAYQRHKNTYFTNLVTLQQQLTTEPSDHDTSRFDEWMLRGVVANTSTETPLRYQVGADVSIETNAGKRIAGTEQHIGDYALFAGIQYALTDDITLQPSVRFTHNTRYAAPVIPAISIRAKPSGETTLRLSYARGFRAPALRELYFLFVDINHNIRGNTELQAESSHNLTGTISYTHTGNASAFTLEGSAFFNRIDNLITLAQVQDDLYSYTNLGHYSTVGGTVSAQYVLSALTLQAAASYTGRYNRLSEDYSAHSFSFAPELQATALYDIHPLDLRFSAFYKYTGRLPGYSLAADGTVHSGFIDDYHTLDVSLATTLANKLLTLSIGGKNLFNVRNIRSTISGDATHQAAASSVSVAWGRTFFCQMQCSLP